MFKKQTGDDLSFGPLPYLKQPSEDVVHVDHK